MIVDASALLAILFDESDAKHLAIAIALADKRAMSAMNWFETAIAIDRRGGPDAAQDFAEFIKRSGIEIVPYTPEHAMIARRAYDVWGKGRHRAGLNMGDCAAYALARERGEPLLFKGDDFSRTDIAPALKV